MGGSRLQLYRVAKADSYAPEWQAGKTFVSGKYRNAIHATYTPAATELRALCSLAEPHTEGYRAPQMTTEVYRASGSAMLDVRSPGSRVICCRESVRGEP